MTISNSKPHLLLTQNPMLTLLLIIFIFFHLPLINSQLDSVSTIIFSSFNRHEIGFLGDASSSGEAIQLTRRDKLGNPLQNSVGRAVYSQPVHIWDANTGNLADFTTVFYFSVNRSGSELHGDGFSFFMAPVDSGIPNNSTGGFLGLFSPQTAMDYPSETQVFAVEFDSFTNAWDPNPYFEFPHIGINMGSIKSVATVGWPSNFERDGAVGRVRIRYDSKTQELLVLVSYPSNDINTASLTHIIDLRSVLPEWVTIGFSAATGNLIEAHDILFWSFKSSFRSDTWMEENKVDIISI